MSEIKERILGAVTVMSDEDAKKLWENILSYFANKSWENIENVEPDEYDLKMIEDIKNNSECIDFISSDELKNSLEL